MSEPSPAHAGPPIAEVRAQLDRILASQALAGSDQLKRLLRVVVERSAGGQSDLLKEYNLGLEVFQRPPDYDPKIDLIVRVQARRLRSKLDQYYAGEGAGDFLVIHILKGAYIPTFEAKPVSKSTGQHRRIWLAAGGVAALSAVFLMIGRESRLGSALLVDRQRSIAVLPLKNYIDDDKSRSHLPDETTELLTTELAKSKQFRVVSRTTASRYRDTTSSLSEIARAMGVRWIVEGGVGSEGSRVYIKLRAVDSLSDRKVFADVYDCDRSQLLEVNTKAVRGIEAAIEANLRSEQ